MVNATTKISQNWFREEVRGLFTGILVLFLAVGYGIGFGIPASIIEGTKNSNGEYISSLSERKESVFVLMIVEAIITGVSLIACILFFKERPNEPPSAAA